MDPLPIHTAVDDDLHSQARAYRGTSDNRQNWGQNEEMLEENIIKKRKNSNATRSSGFANAADCGSSPTQTCANK